MILPPFLIVPTTVFDHLLSNSATASPFKRPHRRHPRLSVGLQWPQHQVALPSKDINVVPDSSATTALCVLTWIRTSVAPTVIQVQPGPLPGACCIATGLPLRPCYACWFLLTSSLIPRPQHFLRQAQTGFSIPYHNSSACELLFSLRGAKVACSTN